MACSDGSSEATTIRAPGKLERKNTASIARAVEATCAEISRL